MSKFITAEYAGQCLTCEEDYDVGEQVHWEPGVGCWHKDCAAPRNLERYKKDAARKK